MRVLKIVHFFYLASFLLLLYRTHFISLLFFFYCTEFRKRTRTELYVRVCTRSEPKVSKCFAAISEYILINFVAVKYDGGSIEENKIFFLIFNIFFIYKLIINTLLIIGQRKLPQHVFYKYTTYPTQKIKYYRILYMIEENCFVFQLF